MGKQAGVLDRVDALVRNALRRSGLSPGARLVVAVSGGPDSLALLHSLKRLQGKTALELHGAHLDHGLRGEASAADARFVAQTFRALSIPLTSGSADVEAYRARRSMSLEEAAREVRYDFLARVATEQDADAVALGHTAADQVETVLMHIVRGSGLAGLAGMEPSVRRSIAPHIRHSCASGNPFPESCTVGGTELLLVRPLLAIVREDTLAYCEALGLEPRLDESNRSPLMTRNRVRMDVMPLLEELNPQVRNALLRLSRVARQQISHLDEQLASLPPGAMRVEAGTVTLDRSLVATLPAAVRLHLLRLAVATARGDLDGIYQAHLDRMDGMLAGSASRTADLPGGLAFSVGYDEATLTFGPPPQPDMPPPLTRAHPLNVPGETAAEGWLVTAHIAPAHDETPPDGALTARLDPGLAGEPLSLRPRQPGDRFQPLGMTGRKKLKDFLIDEKVPRAHRDRIPLLVTPRGIAWVPGHRVAEWAKLPPGAQEALHVHLSRRR